jgi:PAS domain S-box-containing protein
MLSLLPETFKKTDITDPNCSLLDLLPGLIFYLDKDYTFQYTNKRFEELLGTGKSSLPGKSLKQSLDNDTYTLFKRYSDQALAGKAVQFEFEFPLLKQKNRIEASFTPHFNRDGIVEGYLALMKVISGQKNEESHKVDKYKELQSFYDDVAVGIHWVNEDGVIVWANKTELEMLGYTSEEYFGHSISEFHASKEKINDILCRLKNNETLAKYEAPLRCKDGTIKYVQINSNVLWENGQFIHTRCFTVDITDQKKAHDSLRDSEHLYKQLVEGLPIAVYTCDSKGHITLYNEAAAQLWGQKPVIGKDMWSGSWRIFDTNGVPVSLDSCPMAKAIKEKRIINGEELIFEQPDGQKRYVLPHPKPLIDSKGNVIGAVNTLIDITDAKKAEQALREDEERYRQLASDLEMKVQERTIDLKKSEERYHKMVDEVEDYAILLLDKDGFIRNWNKGAEKIKGYKEEEIVGKNFRIFYLPEDRERKLPETLINQAIKSGKALHEGWRVRKDGTTFWGSIVITALHDANNNVIGFTKVTRDLTQRKLAEDKLQQYTRDLEFQNKELKQFNYVASHDIKEPLRKVLYYNSYINDRSANLLPEKEREYLRRSINAAKRMQSLIDDLLTYSRATLEDQNFEKVDLNAILEEVTNVYKEIMEEKEVIINSDKLPAIRGLAFQFKQLFDNLIGNSIKYSHPDRKPQIKITCEKVKGSQMRESEADPRKSYYKITFKDNGIGFEPYYSEKIFEVFQRLQSKHESSGTGIGLAICRKIVQNYKGFIRATGKPNEGAEFDVYLPVNEVEG